MVFNSFKYLLFFPVVTLIYFISKNEKFRLVWLLICSYFFYMCWNIKYAFLMLFSTFITFISGLLMAKYPKKKKIFLCSSLAINLGILFFFKYFNFALLNINKIFSWLNISSISYIDILLPVGISFYTFQSLSYSIDVYRDDVKVEKNFVKYALFVSFFPQLVAGPIEKSKDFLKQFNLKHEFVYDEVKKGLLVMLGGYFLKLVISDRASIVVNNVYNNLGSYSGLALIIATILFAIQIYCDFYAYSLIAKGSAQVLGYKLSDNFNRPYFATSIKDFWRRWHISLSTWFKEYLYIPLGGNRVSRIKLYRNIIIVFLASGLWHGAAWTFIIWGLLHGIYQIIGIITSKYRGSVCKFLKLDKYKKLHKLIQICITFLLVDFAWIFFRANNLSDSIYVLKNMFVFSNGFNGINKLGLNLPNLIVLFISIICLFMYEVFSEKFSLVAHINKMHIVLRWMIYFLIIYIIIIFGVYGPGYDASQFIYFQF